MEINVEDAAGRDYPAKVEIEDAHQVEKILIPAGVGDVRHSGKLGGRNNARDEATRDEATQDREYKMMGHEAEAGSAICLA